MTVFGAAFGIVSVEQGAQASMIVIMVVAIFAVPVLQAGFAQDALDFLAQSFGHKRGVALTAGDAAYIGGVYIKLHGDPLVDTAKNGERFKRVRGSIRLVTIHDFLGKEVRSDSTVTTLTRMVYRIV